MNDRTQFLLWIVIQYTEKDWTTGKLSRFFIPQTSAIYYRDRGSHITTYISGSGDASAFRGLERKGLIERPETQLPNNYIYCVTESGLLEAERLGISSRFE